MVVQIGFWLRRAVPHFDVTSVTPSQNAAGYAHTARGPAGPSPRLGRTSCSQLLGVFVSVRTCVYLCTEGVRGVGGVAPQPRGPILWRFSLHGIP